MNICEAQSRVRRTGPGPAVCPSTQLLFCQASTSFEPKVDDPSGILTLLLRDWREGDRAALDKMFPIIHDELRRLASLQLRGERKDHTLRPTELVSEAYLRIAGRGAFGFTDRVHFFAIASRVMRQILVDHARNRSRGKRGGGVRPDELRETMVAIGRPWELVALDEALEGLAKFDERKARVIELHYFGGLTHEEIAAMCNVHTNTVARDLRLGEAWLQRELSAEPPPE